MLEAYRQCRWCRYFANTLVQAESQLYSVKQATRDVGLYMNLAKTIFKDVQ